VQRLVAESQASQRRKTYVGKQHVRALQQLQEGFLALRSLQIYGCQRFPAVLDGEERIPVVPAGHHLELSRPAHLVADGGLDLYYLRAVGAQHAPRGGRGHHGGKLDHPDALQRQGLILCHDCPPFKSFGGEEEVRLLDLLGRLLMGEAYHKIQNSRNSQRGPQRVDLKDRQRADLSAHEPDHRDGGGGDHGRESGCGAGLFPEEGSHGGQEQSRRIDGKGNEQYVHDVLIEPSEHGAKQAHQQRGEKAGLHKGLVGGLGIEEFLIYVLGETGGTGQHGDVRRGHDGAEPADEYEARQPVGECLHHQRGHHVVGRLQIRQDHLAGHSQIGAGSGDDYDQHGRVDGADLGCLLILGGNASCEAVHAGEKREYG